VANIFSKQGSGSSGGSLGAIFIHDIQPIAGGNVGDKVFLEGSDNSVLLSCSSDSPVIRVYVIALIGSSNLRPSAVVNGVDVGNWDHTAYSSDNRVLFKGYADVNLGAGTVIEATHEDGSMAFCTVLADAKPVISDLIFINGYPGTQTELKLNDLFEIQIMADLPFISVEIDDYEACSHRIISVTSGTIATAHVRIADRGNVSVARPIKARVQKSSGTWSDWFTSNSNNTDIDGTDLVFCNNLRPSIGAITQSSVSYPSSQSALKDSESANVSVSCINFDMIQYQSDTVEISIDSPSVYSQTKTVTRTSGTYNVSTNNYSISVTRLANDSSASQSGVVYIANVDPIISISEPSRLRSGGNDGTQAQNHTVTVSSSQNLYQAPTLDLGAEGTWIGPGFIGSGDTWTRSLQIHDNDIKGTYSYGALQAINLAGKVVTTVSGDNNYIVGGFVSRTVTLQSQHNEAEMNVAAVDYSKVSMTWEAKALPNKRSVGTTAIPDANSWCLHTLSTNPTTIRILDTGATNASSTPTSIVIEESI